jgi:uncharacterized protein YcbK (DUF882 family)
VPIRAARQVLTHGATRAGQSLGLAVLALLLGSQGLQNAVANGDTRTISLHHIHTGEDLTITFKRNGRYDDEALKKINHVLRDWRRDEEITMDPRLLDVVWEVYRDVDAKGPIHVVCGYRAPATNAMLRSRSSGVAQHSQHMLGRAMDFFIPGVPLEKQREAGLRLQRGGVGYYPSSGSPFIHLDVGSVRHWPRMTRDQLVKVFPNGRTVHVPTDGRPLPGYALALADIQQRGSSAPSETSIAAARDAGVDVPAETAPRQRNLFSALFTTKDEDDNSEAAAAAAAAKQGPKAGPKAEKKADKPKQAATKVAATTPLPAARPAERMAPKVDPKPAPAASFNLASAESRPVAPTTPKADTTGAAAPWPVKVADAGGSVSAGPALAYSAQATPAPAAPVTRGLTVPSTASQNAAAPATRVAEAGSEAAPIHTASAAAPTHKAGLPPDDLWLRALVLAPDLRNYLTATVLGQSDMRELLPLMEKPDAVVTTGFGDDPNFGLATDRFTGAAVVFVPTTVFEKKRTAALQ